jgi:hypothetical protein
MLENLEVICSKAMYQEMLECLIRCSGVLFSTVYDFALVLTSFEFSSFEMTLKPTSNFISQSAVIFLAYSHEI